MFRCNYSERMKTRIVKTGDSERVRIRKLPRERGKFDDAVELDSQDNQIAVRSARKPREDWAIAFQVMTNRGDDEWLDKNLLAQTQWDKNDWEW